MAILINPHIDDKDFNEILWIGPCFAEPEYVEIVRTQHFSTAYAYEISSHWDIGTETHRPLDLESKIKLKKLFELLKDYIKLSDYFQLYSC